MTEREQILDAIRTLKIEQRAIKIVVDAEHRLSHAAGMAIKYHTERLRLCDLVIFCNTGKYPK